MSDTPKIWHDMTDAEKGALLLAHHEGKVIEILMPVGSYWREIGVNETTHFCTNSIYRIRPEPMRLTVGKRYRSKNDAQFECIFVRGDVAWMAQCLTTRLVTAYRFNLDGTFIDLGAEYDIIEELP